MNAFGVIAEFNPFHDGHRYLIDKAKELTGDAVCVAAMSGDFTQRGEPAIFDKWKRAGMAIDNGVDLVIEIPSVYATGSAQVFASGGVKVLSAIGGIDKLVFGSETGDLDRLLDQAKLIMERSDEIDDITKDAIKKGISYPKARADAISSLCGYDAPGPNDILAIEYLMELPNTIEPVAIKRTGEGHIETATNIRNKFYSEDPETYKRLYGKMFDLISSRVLMLSADELESYSDNEGLGHKLKNEIRYTASYEDIVSRLKSKVYTRTRITRFLCHVLLGIRRVETDPSYIRVLALNKRGGAFLKEIIKSKRSGLPVISNINKEKESLSETGKNMISFDILSSDVYNIINGYDLYSNSDFVKTPYMGGQ